MAEPYLGEIRLMAFNTAPGGWAVCDGQLLSIGTFRALFALLGTKFGGDGVTSFGLPDMRGRTLIHAGPDHPLGKVGGEQEHVLTELEMTAHRHVLYGGTGPAKSDIPAATSVLGSAQLNLYHKPGSPVAMEPASIGTTGAGKGHENMQPYLTLNFCISLIGTFPTPA